MSHTLELVLKYPLISLNAVEETGTVFFKGKLCINDKDYSISLRQTTLIDGTLNFKLETLDHVNSRTMENIKNNIKNNTHQSILDVLDMIHSVIKIENPAKNIENHCDTYRKVLNEYSEFTKFFINLRTCKLSDDLTTISASVSGKTTNMFYISEFDLPPKGQDHFKPNESLTSLFDQFLADIEMLQPYFDLMEALDRNATVLDPQKPQRKDAYRRIWLGENISTLITFDPYNVYQRPDVRFLGPDRLIEPYNTHLNENLVNWVYQENIYQCILDLLGLEDFPKKATTSKQVNLLVEYGECCICFALRLNDKLPEIICTNPSCEKFYHSQCLYDWLVSLNAKRVFDNISGNCPNCEKTISCPVLD